ncbi:MAG: hypothetical protein A2176_12375 [Spirochaetes bacterium RBG_13_51_14]|nr:MAG: hypothetical protein A2176_12375 [Spirochaetes bacterium RBG_13_51_14]
MLKVIICAPLLNGNTVNIKMNNMMADSDFILLPSTATMGHPPFAVFCNQQKDYFTIIYKVKGF